MSAAPFIVGLIASYGSSFIIINQIIDRRLLSLPKRDPDAIREPIYKQKLRRLLLDEYRSSHHQEDRWTARSRVFVNHRVIPAISNTFSSIGASIPSPPSLSMSSQRSHTDDKKPADIGEVAK